MVGLEPTTLCILCLRSYQLSFQSTSESMYHYHLRSLEIHLDEYWSTDKLLTLSVPLIWSTYQQTRQYIWSNPSRQLDPLNIYSNTIMLTISNVGIYIDENNRNPSRWCQQFACIVHSFYMDNETLIKWPKTKNNLRTGYFIKIARQLFLLIAK